MADRSGEIGIGTSQKTSQKTSQNTSQKASQMARPRSFCLRPSFSSLSESAQAAAWARREALLNFALLVRHRTSNSRSRCNFSRSKCKR